MGEEIMPEYQWGVFWVDLSPAKGSEQEGRRPVLVISEEEINQVLPIVTILSLTSARPGRKVYSTEIFLKRTDTGLQRDSIAMAHQIRAISKERLIQKCGSLESDYLRENIRKAIRLYLDL